MAVDRCIVLVWARCGCRQLYSVGVGQVWLYTVGVGQVGLYSVGVGQVWLYTDVYCWCESGLAVHSCVVLVYTRFGCI